jgi:hypothetical protein
VQHDTASNPAPAPSQSDNLPDIRVFVDGKPLSTLNPTQPSLLSSLNQNKFDSLLRAMSAWASSSDGNKAGSSGASQVRIWTASTETAGGITTEVAYPTGTLAVRVMRPHHPRRR